MRGRRTFGAKGSISATRAFCFVFGIVYGLLGLAGFVAGGGGDRMFAVIPEHFVVGTADHVVHVVVAAAFILVGTSLRHRATIEPTPPSANW